MHFHTTVKLAGTSATGLEVPEEVVTALGAGRKPAVTPTIGDYSYRSTIGSKGGVPMIPLSAEHRTASGIRGGDEVDVDLELDTAPRSVEVPVDLADVLAEAGLTAEFAALSLSKRRAHVLAVEGAKAAETRARRVTKVVDSLTA